MSKIYINTNLDEKQQHSFRSVSRIVNSVKTTEGGGFIVNRQFPTNALLNFDLFLLLDEMDPKYWKPGEAKGAPDILIGDLRLLRICFKVNLSIKILEETQASLGQVIYNG